MMTIYDPCPYCLFQLKDGKRVITTDYKTGKNILIHESCLNHSYESNQMKKVRTK